MTEKTNFDETIIPEMQARERKLDLEEGTNVSAKRTNVARAISAAGDSSSPQPTPSQKDEAYVLHIFTTRAYIDSKKTRRMFCNVQRRRGACSSSR